MTSLHRIGANLNCFTYRFDEALLDGFREIYTDQISPYLDRPEQRALYGGGYTKSGDFNAHGQSYYYTSYGTNPLLWVSSNSWQTYQQFERVFALFDFHDEIKERLDCDAMVRLYCGFFVVGDRADDETFHVDYRPGGNAYTFLTPLFPIDPTHGNLLYKDEKGTTQTYRYKTGEAVIFGDQFEHGTQPYRQSDKTRVLFSLQLGTDKIEYWDILKQTIASQSRFLVLPCGHQRGHCQCLDPLQTSGQAADGSRQVTTVEAMGVAAHHFRSGNLPEARQLCQRVLQLEPVHPFALRMLATIAYKEGEFNTTIDFITRSFVADPDNAQAHTNLGHAYQALGNRDEAKICFQKAIDLAALL